MWEKALNREASERTMVTLGELQKSIAQESYWFGKACCTREQLAELTVIWGCLLSCAAGLTSLIGWVTGFSNCWRKTVYHVDDSSTTWRCSVQFRPKQDVFVNVKKIRGKLGLWGHHPHHQKQWCRYHSVLLLFYSRNAGPMGRRMKLNTRQTRKKNSKNKIKSKRFEPGAEVYFPERQQS